MTATPRPRMRAALQRAYGGPDVLRVEETATPAVPEDGVLVAMRATAVSAADCHMRRADPFIVRFFSGLLRPRIAVAGDVVAGEVVAVGPRHARLRVGDRVFGSTCTQMGAYAEFAALRGDPALAKLPATIDFAAAAALTDGFLTSMPFLRDHGRVRPGQRVLVNGASGAVGSVAVQLAKRMGATVTGVCSGRNADLVRALGADEVIDRQAHDFTRSGRQWDIVFDAAGKSSFGRSRRVLAPDGVYMTTVPSLAIIAQMAWTALFGRRRARFAATGLRTPADKLRDLEELVLLVEAGAVRPAIDRVFPLERMAEAHAYAESGRKAGSVVVAMGDADAARPTA